MTNWPTAPLIRIASNIDDGLMAAQKQRLLTIAQYALAWFTELIEKEEA